MKIIEQLPKHIRCASAYNPEVQSAPTCILWPDQDRQWEPIIPRLREVLPELLDKYDPHLVVAMIGINDREKSQRGSGIFLYIESFLGNRVLHFQMKANLLIRHLE